MSSSGRKSSSLCFQKFLDGLTDEIDRNTINKVDPQLKKEGRSGSHAKVTDNASAIQKDVPTNIKKRPLRKPRSRDLVHDAVVNVILSSQYIGANKDSSGQSSKFSDSESQIKAKMIISIWTMDDQRYYTLSFTSPSSSLLASTRSHSRNISRVNNSESMPPTSISTPSSPTSPFYCSHCGSFVSSTRNTPTDIPLSISPFPPLGAPGKSDVATQPSVLQKLYRMKDAIIDAMEIPVFAMWRDESLAIPNKAASRLMHQKADPISDDAYDLLSRFKVYTEDFERELIPEEYPVVRLCRTQKPFSKWKIGLIDPDSQRKHFDVSGECIVDGRTGEFLAGIVALKDVTEYTDIIKTQSEENDQQFQLICDTMPQMVSNIFRIKILMDSADPFTYVAMDYGPTGDARYEKVGMFLRDFEVN